jgi:glycosyltransferase involved in cell wall biosynthesis
MSAPLRIAFVADGDPENPMKSGSGSPARLIGALRKQGHIVHGVDASLRGVERYLLAARLFRLDRRHWRARFWLHSAAFAARSLRARAQLVRIQAREPLDAVLMYGNDCLPVDGLPVPLFLYADNFSLHTKPIAHSNMAQLTPAEQRQAHVNEGRVFGAARHIFTFSRYIATQFTELAGIDPARLEPVYAGASIDLPERHGSPSWPQPPRILFVGRDWRAKGGPIVMAALEKIVSRFPDVRLTVVGVRELPDAVRRVPWVEDLGLLDKTKPDEAARLSAAYAAATMFVLPTEYDSFPIVILEAMANGLPVVTTNVWALPEMVRDGETGYVIPPGDADGLARRLHGLLADPEQARRMGAAGRARAEQLFTWDHVAQRVVAGIRLRIGAADASPSPAERADA